MALRRNKNKQAADVQSLSESDKPVFQEDSLSSPEPKATKTMPLNETPLLSDPIDLMEHAVNPSGDSFKMESGFFDSTSNNNVVQNNTQTTPSPSPVNNIPPTPPNIMDAPEQTFAPGGMNQDNVLNIPDDISRQSAADLTDTILNIYKDFAPLLCHEVSKVNKDEIKALKEFEKSGDLVEGAHRQLIELNKENKKSLEERSKTDVGMLRKPLQKVLEVRNVKVTPETELIIVLLYIAITYFFLIKNIRDSNKDVVDKIRSMIIDKNKREQVERESEIPLAETETVIK